MSISTIERETFGAPLAPLERLVIGLVVVVGAVGHAALAASVVWFLYVLATLAL